MSYKTKQEAFTAMKDALATLQKLNLPLPKPYQDLVDKCTKVVAANTKTDAVAKKAGANPEPAGMDLPPTLEEIIKQLNEWREKIQSYLKEDKVEAAQTLKRELDAYFTQHQEILKKGGKDKEEAEANKKIAQAIADKSKGSDNKELDDIIKELEKYEVSFKTMKEELERATDEKTYNDQSIAFSRKQGAYDAYYDDAKKAKIAKSETYEKLAKKIIEDIETYAKIKPFEKTAKGTAAWTYTILAKQGNNEKRIEFTIRFKCEQKNDNWYFLSAKSQAKSSSGKESEEAGDRKNIAPFSVSAADETDINNPVCNMSLTILRNAIKGKGFKPLEYLGLVKPRPANPTNPATIVVSDQYDLDPTKIGEVDAKARPEEVKVKAEATQATPIFTITGNKITVSGITANGLKSLDYGKVHYTVEFATQIDITLDAK